MIPDRLSPKNRAMLKPHAICISLLSMFLCGCGVKAQVATNTDSGLLFKHNHFTFYVSGQTSNPRLEFHAGASNVTPASLGFEAGFKYTYNIGQQFGIETGIGAGKQYYYFISTPHNAGLETSGLNIGYAQVPLMLIVRGELGHKFFVYAGAGALARVFDLHDGSHGQSWVQNNTQDVSGYTINYFKSDQNKFDILSNLELGALYHLPNDNMLRLNLSFQLSPGFTTEVDYTLLNGQNNAVGVGVYYIPKSYAGICLGYVFTRSR
jgi:hypothetical protein